MNPTLHPITTELASRLSTQILLDFYRTMVRIRVFEERVALLVQEKQIVCPAHLYIGQEAIATGACKALRTTDYVWGTHRSHGHYIAKGGDLNSAMAEMLGKETGCSHGRGGSMHLIAPEVGILGTVPIVATTIPMAVGSALASQIRRDGRVSVAFFGDGAVEEGVFHESMNLAALKKLPVVFICENNWYSSHLPLSDRQPSDNIHEKASAYSMPGFRGDGNNVVKVYDAVKLAVERARAGGGPSLLEFRTYRWRGHVGANFDLELGIRTKETLESWMERCPIRTLSEFLTEESVVPADDLMRIDSEVHDEVEESVKFACESPYPLASDIQRFLFRD